MYSLLVSKFEILIKNYIIYNLFLSIFTEKIHKYLHIDVIENYFEFNLTIVDINFKCHKKELIKLGLNLQNNERIAI